MKQSWHILAARCAAAHPHWPWSKVCAHVARGRRAKPVRPTVQQHTARLEQLKLFSAGDDSRLTG